MYVLNFLSKDSVHELKDIPQSSVGAPCPMVLADEHHLSVVYYLQDTPDNWDGSSVRIVSPNTEGEAYAIISFSRHKAYYHGAPNDEAFSGHPLHKRGLKPYGAYEVKGSTWIERLMKMNRVHAYHKDELFSDCRHFILAFHDTTFECVANGYSVQMGVGSILEGAGLVLDTLGRLDG